MNFINKGKKVFKKGYSVNLWKKKIRLNIDLRVDKWRKISLNTEPSTSKCFYNMGDREQEKRLDIMTSSIIKDTYISINKQQGK